MMDAKLEEVPSTCPLLDTCDRKVTKDCFDVICMSRSWMICGDAREVRKKYELTPSEWRILLEEV